MPHTDAQPSYQVVLTAAEFRLITMGLAGMIQDSEDIRAALRLNVQLCQQRAVQLRQAHEIASKALQNATEMESNELPPI